MSGGKHTRWPVARRPWSFDFVRGRAAIVDADGQPVAFIDSTRGKFEPEKANAEYVIQCANVHDELVAALDKLAHYAECQVAAFSSGRPYLDMTLLPSLCLEARAALSKAGTPTQDQENAK